MERLCINILITPIDSGIEKIKKVILSQLSISDNIVQTDLTYLKDITI